MLFGVCLLRPRPLPPTLVGFRPVTAVASAAASFAAAASFLCAEPPENSIRCISDLASCKIPTRFRSDVSRSAASARDKHPVHRCFPGPLLLSCAREKEEAGNDWLHAAHSCFATLASLPSSETCATGGPRSNATCRSTHSLHFSFALISFTRFAHMFLLNIWAGKRFLRHTLQSKSPAHVDTGPPLRMPRSVMLRYAFYTLRRTRSRSFGLAKGLLCLLLLSCIDIKDFGWLLPVATCILCTFGTKDSRLVLCTV